ncbi:MAG: TlpA family protein disulfide reductase [Candidatus Dormibacteria bacterium]
MGLWAAPSAPRRLRRLLWTAVLVALIGSAALALVRGRQPISPGIPRSALEPSALVGKPLPQLKLFDLDGHPVSVGDLRGRPVLLNFWATWCVPCRAEMPELQFEARKFANSARVIGVDEGEPVDVIRQFTGEIGVTYPIWRDPTNQVDGILKAPGLPYSIYLGKDGRVRTVRLGIMVRSYIDDQLTRSVAAG